MLKKQYKPKIAAVKYGTKPKVSKDFTEEKSVKVAVRNNEFSDRIKVRHFEPEEVSYTSVPVGEALEKKYERASFGPKKIKADERQEIINEGLQDYLSEHVHETKYIQLPAKHKRPRQHLVKAFRINKKQDFNKVFECMREDKYVVLVNASGLAKKDPELVKKFVKQLDFSSFVHHNSIKALDEKVFAIIPNFARFQK
jgi:SepF-like predicted cell division protein (DUF552 family)